MKQVVFGILKELERSMNIVAESIEKTRMETKGKRP